MSSTYSSLHVHFVFSKQNLVNSIEDSFQHDLYAYLGGVAKGLGARVVEANGVADHVHLLVSVRPTQCVADLVREPKRGSSKWVHETRGRPGFAWQGGYATFAVDAANVARVRTYIAGQAAHHRKVSAKEELLELCAAEGIDVDMRYFE